MITQKESLGRQLKADEDKVRDELKILELEKALSKDARMAPLPPTKDKFYQSGVNQMSQHTRTNTANVSDIFESMKFENNGDRNKGNDHQT